MFDWEDLRHFVALAEAGTLSGAARALRVDHATVGRRVAALEQALGSVLVERQARRCVLTEAGQRIAGLAMTMQAQAHALDRAARALHTPLAGTVTVSAPPVFASHVLAPRLGELRRLYPDLHLSLLGDPATASLGRQEADIAIRLSRPREARNVARRLGCMAFGLYAAPGYLQDRPPAAWDFIAYDGSLEHVPQQAWLRQVAADRPVVFRSNDLASQIAAARAGVGIAALPCFLADEDAGLAKLPVRLPACARDIWLVVHADLRRMPAVRAVMEFLARQVAAAGLGRPDAP
ncbi:LysR family transcriptional regulator [Rhodovastum atsumiense]|uniref:LysR family transcriptional regulator n=1 Tax=Rhodovastum atsumiense TaxID=504468 RepID=A0A5M6IRK9_9PROT|nr:LysR family transcriptional regulator [Rhodovastum atsumiense]KAA5610821.1 LysR family transcriptional regulator [Rhodovastum atsumiense]CAH2602133.1 LysR family transcriptional regulator [Rhodovastum atsumiense]